MCWNCPRVYQIPANLLVKGENTIAIRAIDTGGGGCFSGKMYLKNEGGTKISIAGEWRFKHIAGINSRKFLVFESNPKAIKKMPEGIENFNLSSHTQL